MHFVYVLQSETTGRWYIGYTTDVRTRVEAHNKSRNVSTAHRGPWRLIYYEAYLEKMDALGRERFLKSGSGHRFLKKQLQRFLCTSTA